MRMDGVTLVAVIVIGSFAIERITKALLFLLSLLPAWRGRFPDPSLADDAAARLRLERNQTLVYYTFASVIGLVVLAGYGNVRMLYAVGIETNPIFDAILTGLILVGGAERVAELIKAPGSRAADKAPDRPVKITGTLVLEDSSGSRRTSLNAPLGV